MNRVTGAYNQYEAKSNFHEIAFNLMDKLEYAFVTKSGFSFIPLAHIQYTHDHCEAYQESGSGVYDLSVHSQKINALSTSLDARFEYDIVCHNADIRLELDTEWQREFLNHNRNIECAPFNITSIPTNR